jgi:hypothetical protein
MESAYINGSKRAAIPPLQLKGPPMAQSETPDRLQGVARLDVATLALAALLFVSP